MKAVSEWKGLTKTQRRTWSAWAKNHPVLLDDGTVRRVGGRKAMSMAVRNRIAAGEAANPTVLPAEITWLDGALTLNDAGPFTTNAGFIGFRATQNLNAGTKWFVWATPPLPEATQVPLPSLRFVTCLAPGAVAQDDLVGMNAQYLAVNGSWDGPDLDGAWPDPMCVWFRVNQYHEGYLSPGVTMKGLIQVEL